MASSASTTAAQQPQDGERDSERKDLSASDLTLPSASSAYHPSSTPSPPSQSVPSSSPSSSSEGSPVVLYKPPTFWSIVRGAAINLLLPFVNGLMLGFGELFAHEAAFRLGWSNTKVFPYGSANHPIGPGVEIREDTFNARRRDVELEELASLE